VTAARSENARGIGWMLAAVAALSAMDATMKALSARYPPLEVAALRGGACLPIVVVWVLVQGGFRQLLRVRWALQLGRGALGIVMLVAFVTAVHALPLAEAYSIFFVAPLLITAMSRFLGERVDARRWAAIGAGFLGVLVVLRPTGAGALTLAGLAAIASAACYAVAAILVRVIARTDSTLSMVFWFLAVVTAGAGALAAPHWVPVARGDLPLLGALAVSGAIGQFALTEAFRRGEASVLAPFEYTALAWGLVFDWLVWSTRPDAPMLAGAALVVGAGVYLVRRERAPPGVARVVRDS